MKTELDYICHLDIDYDYDQLLYETMSLSYSPYQNPVKSPDDELFDYVETWLTGFYNDHNTPSMVVHSDFPECKRLATYFTDLLNCEVVPRAYRQIANSIVPIHIDYRTKSAINIILTDDPEPITFITYGDVYYKMALLNVARKHSVSASKQDRILVKFSLGTSRYRDILKCLEKDNG